MVKRMKEEQSRIYMKVSKSLKDSALDIAKKEDWSLTLLMKVFFKKLQKEGNVEFL